VVVFEEGADGTAFGGVDCSFASVVCVGRRTVPADAGGTDLRGGGEGGGARGISGLVWLDVPSSLHKKTNVRMKY